MAVVQDFKGNKVEALKEVAAKMMQKGVEFSVLAGFQTEKISCKLLVR